MNTTGYSALSALNLAAELQEIQLRSPIDEGMGQLIRVAGRESDFTEFSIALCRLLFHPKDGGEMRHPLCGEPRMVGDSSLADWPRFPIHIFGGIPFLVVMGWTVAGRQETGADYLAYCLRDCDWVDEKIEAPSLADTIATSFTRNGPWQRRLTPEEQTFILSQV